MTLTSEATLDEKLTEALRWAESGEADRAALRLAECVSADPGNLDFVERLLELLAAQRASKTNGQPHEADLPAEVQPAIGRSDWREVLRLAPPQLAARPASSPILSALATAAAEERYDAIAIAYLQHALALAPDDPQLNQRLALLLTRVRRFDEAIARWQHLELLSSDNGEAPRAIAQLVALRSRQRLGLECIADPAAAGQADRTHRRSGQSPTFLQAVSAAAANLAGETSAPGVKRTPIQELEIAIREFPSNVDYYLQLVPLYLARGREYDAEKLLDKGRQATAGDPRVCQLWEDVTMLRMERKLALAQKHADEEDSPAARDELAQALVERDKLETDIFHSRCQRDPHNAAVRVELGKRLRRAGKLRDACQRLEEALRDPAQKSYAALELGECFRQQGQPSEALRYYRLAADSATQPELLDARKRGLYLAGCLAAKLKLRQLAERYLGEVLRLDANYKDAPALMAELRQARD